MIVPVRPTNAALDSYVTVNDAEPAPAPLESESHAAFDEARHAQAPPVRVIATPN